jgi:hypothetical protein
VPCHRIRQRRRGMSSCMQNVNPMVHEISANPPQHDIIDEPGRPASGVTPTNLRLDMLSGITVDTIGLGTGQAFVDLLAAISRESGGLTPAGPTGVARSTANSEDLRQFFVEQLIETLRGFSPQLVGYRRGALGNDGATEAFAVNKNARKLLFKVSWPQGHKLEVRALKDGTEFTSSARMISGTFYRILAFDLPAKGPPAHCSANGSCGSLALKASPIKRRQSSTNPRCASGRIWERRTTRSICRLLSR